MAAAGRSVGSWGDPVAAGAAVALGLILFAGARQIEFAAGYDRIGPRFFPYAVAAGLLLLGASLAASVVVRRLRGARAEIAEGDRIDWRPLGLALSALLSSILLLGPAGFVLASAVQFWLVARAFRSARPLRDALVAVLFSVAVYYGFTAGLGLSLPPGPWERSS